MVNVTSREIDAYLAEARSSGLSVFAFAIREGERMLAQLAEDCEPRQTRVVRTWRDQHEA